MRHVLEVDFVELVPVFEQLFEFLILVFEQLHLFSRFEQLLSVGFQFFLHGLQVLQVALMLLLKETQLLLEQSVDMRLSF